MYLKCSKRNFRKTAVKVSTLVPLGQYRSWLKYFIFNHKNKFKVNYSVLYVLKQYKSAHIIQMIIPPKFPSATKNNFETFSMNYPKQLSNFAKLFMFS